jgi:hypothetical protein
MSRLFNGIDQSHGQQLSHVRAWRRHTASLVKALWNEGVRVKEICDRFGISENVVEHILRGNICPSAGPAVTPRRCFGKNQKRRLRELAEIPG